MDISRILRARMSITRSEFADRSSQEPDKTSIVYTFVGYGPGNTCTVKNESGKILPAKLQTNGLINPGQQICVVNVGGELIVKGMNRPPEPKPDEPDSTEQLKIKILWVKIGAGVELWMGGDRAKPKLIHTFTTGTKIRGLCHNHGEGDRYAIGVVTTIGEGDARKYEQWNWVGSPKEESSCKLLDFKSSRVQPIGHGLFVDPWLPPDMLDGRLLGRSKSGKLFVFTNEIPCLVGEFPTLKSAKILRKKEDGYDVITEVGTVKAAIGKSTFTEAKKAKWKDWVWLLFDDLALDPDGSGFKDKNIAGKSIVSGTRITRDLKLKAWKTLKAVFSQMGALWTRTENTWGEKVSFQVSKGQFDAGAITDIKIELKRTVGQRPIGSGDDVPPPGDDPNKPYKGRYFSFVWDIPNGSGGEFTKWNKYDVWIAKNYAGDLTDNGSFYRLHPSTPLVHQYEEPYWKIEGIYLTQMTYTEWNNLRRIFNEAWHRNRIDIETPRRSVPEWMEQTAFDSYFRYHPGDQQYEPGDLMYPVIRYITPEGFEAYSGGRWDNMYGRFRVIKWKGSFFLNPDSNPDSQPPDREPQYEPWEVELYKWRDPIVCSKDQKYLLLKQWVESASKGRPPSPPMNYKAQQIVLMSGASETTIKGDLPLLCAEDTLIGSKLYRVDRSSLEPESPTAETPKRSTIRRLPVETYPLTAKTKRSVKAEKIYPVPQDAIVLSASYCP